MGALRVLLVVVFFSLVVTSAFGQSAPQVTRDYVYGPGGRLVVTIEPDIYAPTEPYGCSASQTGACAIDGIDVSWNEAMDLGSGIAHYNGPGGPTTVFSYHDGGVQGGECYTYYVSAVDNAGNEGPAAISNTVCIDLCIDAHSLFPRQGEKKRGAFAHFSFLAIANGQYNLRRTVRPYIKLVERPKPIMTPQLRLVLARPLPKWLRPQPPTVAAGGGAGGEQ
jgi:hypothetical protein